MQLLLSNPPRRKRGKKTKTKRRTVRRASRRRRRANRAKAQRSAVMARKNSSRPSRRTYRRSGRRRGGGVRRGGAGFIDTTLLTAGAAVAGGFFGAQLLTGFLPASFASNQFAAPLAKVGAGLATAALGRKWSPTLAYSLAAGMIGSGVLDIVGPYLNRGGTAAGARPAGVAGYVEGYATDIPGGLESDAPQYIGEIVGYELGAYQLPDGSTVDGYLTDQGEVVTPGGSVVGMLDLDDPGDDGSEYGEGGAE